MSVVVAERKGPPRWLWTAAAILGAIGWSPVVFAVIGLALAPVADCQSVAGQLKACALGGDTMGEILTVLVFAHWFLVLTAPLILASFVLGAVAAIWTKMARRNG